MKLEELVDKLKSLFDLIWSADEMKSATGSGAADFCDLVGKVGVAVRDVRAEAQVAYHAALEAYWADKARGFAVAAPDGKGAVHPIDEYMAISRAAVELDTKLGEFLCLIDAFAMEFISLSLKFYQPRFCGRDIEFECRDVFTCKKQADALKRLARAIEELEGGYDHVKIHDAIIQYCGEIDIVN